MWDETDPFVKDYWRSKYEPRWELSLRRIRGFSYWVWTPKRWLVVGLEHSEGVLRVPLYLLVLPLSVPSFLLAIRRLRLAHRLKHNLCTHCGYSRAGIAEGAKCPECGH